MNKHTLYIPKIEKKYGIGELEEPERLESFFKKNKLVYDEKMEKETTPEIFDYLENNMEEITDRELTTQTKLEQTDNGLIYREIKMETDKITAVTTLNRNSRYAFRLQGEKSSIGKKDRKILQLNCFVDKDISRKYKEQIKSIEELYRTLPDSEFSDIVHRGKIENL